LTVEIQLGQEGTKKAKLLSNENIKRWYDNLYSASPHTAIPRLYRLSNFCERAKIDPEALVKLDQKKLEDIVQDKVRDLEKEGLAPDYIHGVITAIKSWLLHNEREIKRNIRIKDMGESRIQSTEKVPEPSQVMDILTLSTVRGRVSISFLAFSGVRPEVLGSVDGTDGLVLGDLPDLDIEALKFKQIPAQVIVRKAVSKVRHQYFTFLNEKGCDNLLTYLRQRVEQGEKLTKESPVIKSDSRKKVAALKIYPKELKYFLCTQNITEEVKRAIIRAGLNERPYVLRSYFAQRLLQAGLDNKMNGEIRAFFEGHKGDIERDYTTGKHNLNKDMMAKVRQQYLNGSPYLDGSLAELEKIEQASNDKLSKAREEIEAQVKAEYEPQMKALTDRVNAFFSILNEAEKKKYLECVGENFP